MSDLYGNLLRRWSLTEAGSIECVHDAVDVTLISPEDRSAIEAHNAALHAAMAAVGAYEAAQRVLEPEEPHTQPVLDDEGEEIGTEPTPAYAAWTAAQLVLSEATAEITALARMRAGEPEEGDAQLVADAWSEAPDVSIDPAMIARQQMPALLPYQFAAVLDLAELRSVATAAVAAIENPVEQTVARCRMDLSQRYERLDPLFRQLSAAAELPDEQVDALWAWAAAL